MILSHMASSYLNMSAYRAVWTHFRSNSVYLIFKNYLSELQISRHMDAQPSGRRSEGGGDSRWVPGFTIGSWIHDGFLDSR